MLWVLSIWGHEAKRCDDFHRKLVMDLKKRELQKSVMFLLGKDQHPKTKLPNKEVFMFFFVIIGQLCWFKGVDSFIQNRKLKYDIIYWPKLYIPSNKLDMKVSTWAWICWSEEKFDYWTWVQPILGTFDEKARGLGPWIYQHPQKKATYVNEWFASCCGGL